MSGSFSLSDYLAVEETQYGRKAYGLKRMDARVKLGLCALLVLLNVLLAKPQVSAAVLALSWLGLLFSRVGLKPALWFILAPAWATGLVILGFSVGFGHSELFHWGPLVFYREGLAQGLAAGLRVLSEMACAAALILTTPFTRILEALRWFKLPEVLVETLGFMYRYIFLIFDEAEAMREAALIRGGFSTRLAGFRSTGSILAHTFLRAYDRAQRISLAMRARGGE